MKFASVLHPAVPIKREKRFFLHATLEATGEPVVAHCANTGSLKGALTPDVGRVWLSYAPSPTRKLAYTLELAEWPGGALVGVHNGRTNALVREALDAHRIAELGAYGAFKAEVSYSKETRFDFLLEGEGGRPHWLEVKHVSMKASDGLAAFPDAVSERAAKHVRTLAEAVAAGAKATLLFVVARRDCPIFRPADEIDPAYGAALRLAALAGVQLLAYTCALSTEEIILDKPLPIVL